MSPTPSAGAAALRTAAETESAYDAVLIDQTLPGNRTDLFVQDLARMGHPGPAVILGQPPASSLLFGGGRTVPHVSKPIRSTVLHGVLMDIWDLAELHPQRSLSRHTPQTGVRILVVEDNPVNQLVASGFLEALGCQVELADDGHQALAFLLGGDHDFDLVLMDCRMPRMDGYDATRAIRTDETAWLGPGRSGVPIVAMTASVLAGERERCLDAGMSDFLTKPVDSAELARCLRRWVPALRSPAQGPSTTPSSRPEDRENTEELEVLDPHRVAVLSELVKDGVSFFDRARLSFASRVDEMVQRVESEALGDGDALVSAAHTLKGSAENLGLKRLGALAGSVEYAAESGDLFGDLPEPGTLPEPVGRLREVAAEAVQALWDCAGAGQDV